MRTLPFPSVSLKSVLREKRFYREAPLSQPPLLLTAAEDSQFTGEAIAPIPVADLLAQGSMLLPVEECLSALALQLPMLRLRL